MSLRMSGSACERMRRTTFAGISSTISTASSTIQLVEHLAQLGVRKAADEQLLRVRLHFDERLGRQLLRQQPEQQRQAGFLQPVKDRGDIRGIHRG